MERKVFFFPTSIFLDCKLSFFQPLILHSEFKGNQMCVYCHFSTFLLCHRHSRLILLLSRLHSFHCLYIHLFSKSLALSTHQRLQKITYLFLLGLTQFLRHRQRTNTDIFPELSCWKSRLELFQKSAYTYHLHLSRHHHVTKRQYGRLTISSTSSNFLPFASGKKKNTQTAAITLLGNQINPYRGPQFKAEGLMK